MCVLLSQLGGIDDDGGVNAYVVAANRRRRHVDSKHSDGEPGSENDGIGAAASGEKTGQLGRGSDGVSFKALVPKPVVVVAEPRANDPGPPVP